MKHITSHYKKIKFTYIKFTVIALLGCMFFLKGYIVFEKTGDNFFHVFVNGTEVVGDTQKAEELFVQARKDIALKSEELTFIEADMTLQGEEVLWGVVDNETALQERMEEVMQANVHKTTHRSYTLKVNEYMENPSVLRLRPIWESTSVCSPLTLPRRQRKKRSRNRARRYTPRQAWR